MSEPNPYELVRAKDEAGNEYTTSRVAAESAGSQLLDKPAVDGFGYVVPTKTFLDLKAEEDLYDPSGHTVDEVLEYLGAVDVTEAARVQEAEAAGKGRVGIASWAPAQTTTDQSQEA